MSKKGLNDHEREMWVNSYEPLYRWWKSARCGLTVFIRHNRAEIDRIILSRLDKER